MIDPMFSNGRWWLVYSGAVGNFNVRPILQKLPLGQPDSSGLCHRNTAGCFCCPSFHGKVLPQVQSTMRSFNPAAGFGSVLLSLIIVAGVVTTLIYFYFSKEHKGLLGGTAKVGIWFIMISFGRISATP